MLGIVDLRSMGYYKIKKGILQQNLCKYYRFESVDTIYDKFNKFINALKKERWKCNERKYMSNREILDKYVDLDKSCLIDEEKKQVMYMLY